MISQDSPTPRGVPNETKSNRRGKHDLPVIKEVKLARQNSVALFFFLVVGLRITFGAFLLVGLSTSVPSVRNEEGLFDDGKKTSAVDLFNGDTKPSVISSRLLKAVNTDLQRTAIVRTNIGIIEECDVITLRHLVESTPGMDVWVLTSHHKLSESDRNISLTNIRSIPGLFHAHQLESETENQIYSNFNGHSGTSKLSFLKFAAENENYDFVWHLESDVFYSGPWIEFFQDEGRDNSSDFVSPAIIPKDRWMHKPRCTVYGKRCPASYQVGWQAARFSTRMARALWDAINERKIHGHHEAVVYAMAAAKEYTMRQIDQLKVSRFRFGMNKIKDLKKFNPAPGMIMHPFKCISYSSIKKFSEHFEWYAIRPIKSQNENWENWKTLQPLMPVYSIQSLGPRTGSHMANRKAFEVLGPMRPINVTDVARISVDKVSEWIEDGTLRFWNTTQSALPLHNYSMINSTTIPMFLPLERISKILTFCEAMLGAYQAGHEQVLMIEDETFLPKKLAAMLPDHLKKKSETNPNWEVLGLRSTDSRQMYPTWSDGWTEWNNEDVHAYVVHRRGMESILSQIHSLDAESGKSLWRLPPIAQPFLTLAHPNSFLTTANMIPNSTHLESASGLAFRGSTFVGISPDFL